ncbi:MAG: homoserine kinase type II [Gammaproteobacteria bacterium]|jgi:homoserine kinase type II
MSVYTTIERIDLDRFLEDYNLGQALEFEGIKNGITNTNYWLKTTTGHYVLTLYEVLTQTELCYVLGLQRYLSENGVSVATPEYNRKNKLLSEMNQRPAAITKRITGNHSAEPSAQECRLIGRELARFHKVGQNYQPTLSNPRGLQWMKETLELLTPFLLKADRYLIKEELETAHKLAWNQLPRSPIHADCFHDNVLFDGGKLSGIIDFDYACTDYSVYDLAITINDWCIDTQRSICVDRARALLNAYECERPLVNIEKQVLSVFLRLAALRFWLSRLYDKCFPMAGSLVFTKDPNEFRNLLCDLRDHPIDFKFRAI